MLVLRVWLGGVYVDEAGALRGRLQFPVEVVLVAVGIIAPILPLPVARTHLRLFGLKTINIFMLNAFQLQDILYSMCLISDHVSHFRLKPEVVGK